LLQRVTSDGNADIPDGVLDYVHELLLATAGHLSHEDHVMNLRKIVLARSSIGAECTVASRYLNSTAMQLSLATPVPSAFNRIPSNVLQALIAVCDRSSVLLASVPHLSRSKSSFESLRRNITDSSPHVLPNLDAYTLNALSCNISLPVVEMLVKTTNLMFMSQFTWPLDSPILSFVFEEDFSRTYAPVVITQV
jgi:hypothetical protein